MKRRQENLATKQTHEIYTVPSHLCNDRQE